jgi:hypothetical protein
MTITDAVPETPAIYATLDNAIRDILATTGESNPRRIADLLLKDIPQDKRDEALREALPSYVRAFIVQNRALSSPQRMQAVLVRSALRTGIVDAWRQVLDDRVNVAGTDKRLADCTWSDLDQMARRLRQQAESFKTKAQRYERIRDELSGFGPNAVVGDLPVDTLKELFGALPNGEYSIPDPD